MDDDPLGPFNPFNPLADEPGWHLDASDPEHPFGWNDDGIFAVYQKGLLWYPITTRRRLYWERWIKNTLIAIGMFAGFILWVTIVGLFRAHNHIGYATLLLAGPPLWIWGYVYGKSR